MRRIPPQATQEQTILIGRRVQALRRRRGIGQERLGALMAEQGIPWYQTIIANLETGRRRSISITEWLCLAYVLDVAPLELLSPDGEAFRPTPAAEAMSGEQGRDWITAGVA